jgi:hypothetical protein
LTEAGFFYFSSHAVPDTRGCAEYIATAFVRVDSLSKRQPFRPRLTVAADAFGRYV